MACSAIHSGSNFLASVIANLDCQGQTLGYYGYLELAQPGSPAAHALNGLLTLFVALFGIRLMFGRVHDGADVLGDIVKIGIVLTLATSWPAWRTLGYDIVMRGPVEIAAEIGQASGLSDTDQSLPGRLQNADNGIVAITAAGSGRLTGEGGGSSQDQGDSFKGIAMPDYSAFGWGRVAFLVGAVGPYAAVRLGAGILLAVAPLMAGLLLFSGPSALFFGWLRGLVFCALGNLGYVLVQTAQLSVLEPWLAEILRTREGSAFTPSAPTELLVIALAFCLATLGISGLAARVCFSHTAMFARVARSIGEGRGFAAEARTAAQPVEVPMRPIPAERHSRAHGVADAVATTMRREQAADGSGTAGGRSVGGADRGGGTGVAMAGGAGASLGDSFRRPRPRASATANRRDG